MNTHEADGMSEADELEAYRAMSNEDVKRMVLLQLIKAKAEKELSRLRPKDLISKPVDGLKELGIRGLDVTPVGDATGSVRQEV